MQELFLKLQRSGGFFRARNSRAYVRRAAIHLAFDWRRGQKRRNRVRQNLLDAAVPLHTTWLADSRLMTLPRVAASISCAAAVLGLVLLVIWLAGSKSVALADVQNRLKQTRSVRLTQTTKVPGRPDARELAGLILADGRCRIESSKSWYTIMDTRLPKIMLVSETDKKVIISHERPPYGPVNLYDYLRNIHHESAQRLPQRQIDGKTAVGFAVMVKHGPFPPTKVSIWVDPDTDLPVRMESTEKDEQGREVVQVIYDIRFDEEIDESLLSFEVPDGYAIEELGLTRLLPVPREGEQLSPEVNPTVGLGLVRFGMNRDEVFALLGKPDSINADGSVLAYFSSGFTVYVSPRRGVTSYLCYTQAALAVDVRDFTGKTSDGVGIGSSLEELTAAFGMPDVVNETGPLNRTVWYHTHGLEFTLADNKVVRFMVHAVRHADPD
jgi:outer membrane lipoprotein-sorting protein